MKAIAHLEPRHLNSGPLQSFSNKQREEASNCNSAISPACPEPLVFSWLIGLTSQSLTLPTKAHPSLLDHFSPLHLTLSTPDTLLSHLQRGRPSAQHFLHAESSPRLILLVSLPSAALPWSLPPGLVPLLHSTSNRYVSHCMDNVHPCISLTNCKLHENKDCVVLLTIWPPVLWYAFNKHLLNEWVIEWVSWKHPWAHGNSSCYYRLIGSWV